MKATGSRAEVMHGVAKATTGGLTKSKLTKGKDGSIKSKAMKKRGKEDHLKEWRDAVKKARKKLGVDGFPGPFQGLRTLQGGQKNLW